MNKKTIKNKNLKSVDFKKLKSFKNILKKFKEELKNENRFIK